MAVTEVRRKREKVMRFNKRKVVVKLIESEKVHNHRLAEFLANKYREERMKNGI